jgi:hypothetical protein
MTTAKSPARYSAMESARSGDFATAELHHYSGHDPNDEPLWAQLRLNVGAFVQDLFSVPP